MLNKKMLVGSTLLGMMSLGFASQVFAAEGDTQNILGKDGHTSAEVTTRGNLGKIDETDPETPLPEGDERWINVTLPTAVVFESKDQKVITSPKNYKIENNSGRPVKVDVTSYKISGGNGVEALKSLNITRSAGYQGSESVALVTDGAKVGENVPNVKEFVRLANKDGVFGKETDGNKSTNFEFTGTMDASKLKENKNFVESNLTFKFTALRMDGQTIDQAKPKN